MPIYEFLCEQCDATRDVNVDHKTKTGLELLCVRCGGVMRAREVTRFNFTLSAESRPKEQGTVPKPKACGHTHACRCAVKMTQPNPFQAEIDSALENGQS